MAEVIVEPTEALMRELDRSLKDFARLYLKARESQYLPGKFLSVDDARANAVLEFEKQGRELPEVVRFRLHRMLLIERAVEPS